MQTKQNIVGDNCRDLLNISTDVVKGSSKTDIKNSINQGILVGQVKQINSSTKIKFFIFFIEFKHVYNGIKIHAYWWKL